MYIILHFMDPLAKFTLLDDFSFNIVSIVSGCAGLSQSHKKNVGEQSSSGGH